MLPTPSTSHVNYNRIYEPAEDSFLLLDTLASPSETTFLRIRFPPNARPDESSHVMTVSVVRTTEAWYVRNADRASSLETLSEAGWDTENQFCSCSIER